jgi:hypothetical protein
MNNRIGVLKVDGKILSADQLITFLVRFCQANVNVEIETLDIDPLELRIARDIARERAR